MSLKIGNTLLTGASGILGRAIVGCHGFNQLLTPTRCELDITDINSIRNYFQSHQIAMIIHTAALARMKDCHHDPLLAISTNIIGTHHLVECTLEQEQKTNQPIRFIHISTDGVYESTVGNYKETDSPSPYNFYGLTKLAAEYTIHRLKNHCIIRTRFTKPNELNLPAATNSYSSALEINALADAILKLANHPFIGTINVGDKHISDYDRLKLINPAIKPTTIEKIQSQVPFRISTDASMNCSQWKNL